MDTSLYYQYNPWWEEKDYLLKDVIDRPKIQNKLNKFLTNPFIIFLTGLRRVGKTTLIKMMIQSLLQDKVPAQHIFYVSLDDFLLKDLSILDILTEYRKLHRLTPDVKIYAFLDEISYKTDFRIQLKNIYDSQNVKIFASSSSSSILRNQKGFLTGREISVEIPPLTFKEFLIFKNITIKKKESFLIESYFEEYLQIGGMPEYVLNQDREYLTALVDDILYKDIVAFHNIKNHSLIRDYFMLLMERAGKQVSINKIATILGISPDTAKRYLHMFEETYLINLIPRFGKTNDTILSKKKLYATDLGIRNLFTGFRDKGATFEHVVFSMIKSLNPKYYLENEIEIDFITQNKILIEVKYNQEMKEKQQNLFDKIPASKKIIIHNVYDLEILEDLIELSYKN